MPQINQSIEICQLCGHRDYGHLTSEKLFFCSNCWYGNPIDVARLISLRQKRHKAMAQQQSSQVNFNSKYFNNVFQTVPLGGDSEVAQLVLLNGDSEDYIRLEIKGWLKPNDFKVLAGFLTLVLQTNAKWDKHKSCWFMPVEAWESILPGLKIFIEGFDNLEAEILDKRTKYESFDEFFNTPPPMNSGQKPQTKQELIESFNKFALEAGTIVITPMFHLDEAKKAYRKLALAFHPDRNNGDSSRMTELNVIWAELQTKF